MNHEDRVSRTSVSKKVSFNKILKTIQIEKNDFRNKPVPGNISSISTKTKPCLVFPKIKYSSLNKLLLDSSKL